jgi:cephalosporin hydroxylase
MDALSNIAKHHITDKGLDGHKYTPVYNKYFEHLRNKEITLIEVGIGGYDFIDRGGGSLNMWAEYFTKGKVIGIDLYDKTKIKKFEGVKIYKCDQVDGHGLNDIINIEGNPDIIIDDASHINDLTIQTFKILFPYLKTGGVYVIEDCHTSYWKENYRGTKDLKSKETAIGFSASLIHSLHIESGLNNDLGITSIHFYKQQIFIFK